ncbi:FHA domain-containing protein [Terrabacter carboxydivorans]
MSRSDTQRLHAMTSRGEVVMVPDADTHLLALAISQRGVILSNDRFVDHLRTPGIEQARLVGWTLRDRTLCLVDRSLDRLQSVLISQRAAKQERKQLGLIEGAPELDFKWFCRSEPCPRDMVALPRLERRRILCPQCGSYLERGEAWRSPVWLKILHGSVEIARFVLEDGDSIRVGRASDGATLSLAGEIELADDVLHLDPHHLELMNEGGTTWVADLNTQHGTAMRYPASKRSNVLLPPVQLEVGREVALPLAARVVMGRTPFTVQIAGRPGG